MHKAADLILQNVPNIWYSKKVPNLCEPHRIKIYGILCTEILGHMSSHIVTYIEISTIIMIILK